MLRLKAVLLKYKLKLNPKFSTGKGERQTWKDKENQRGKNYIAT